MQIKEVIQIIETDLLIELDGAQPSFIIEEKTVFSQAQATLTRYKLNHVGSDEERYLFVHNLRGTATSDYILSKVVITGAFNSVREEHPWLITNDLEFTSTTTVTLDDNKTVVVFQQKIEDRLWSPDTYIANWETVESIVDYLLIGINTGYCNENGGWIDFYEGRRFEESELIRQNYNVG